MHSLYYSKIELLHFPLYIAVDYISYAPNTIASTIATKITSL